MAYDAEGRAIPRDVVREDTFWTADLLEAANELVPVIRDRRPQVLNTYNEIGNMAIPIIFRLIGWPCTPPSLPGWRLPPRPRRALDSRSGVLVHHEQGPDDGRHPGATRRG